MEKNRNCSNWIRLCWTTFSCCIFKKFQVIGYDSNKSRISELKKGFDKTGSLKKKI